MFSAPHPRSRIYTKLKSYTSFFRDLIFGRIKKGPGVEILEKKLAEKLKVPYVVCAPMARSGIYLVLKNLIRPGQGVIMSPYTIADVVNMVICAGGRPVFIDIEQNSCNLDPAKIEQAIDGNTGAVLVTHLHGIAAQTEEILEICQRHNLPLLEDAAQAFGASQNGKRLGTIGQAGIYSFGMYKNINSWYGGAVVSHSKELIDKIRFELSGHGYQSSFFLLKRIFKGLLTDSLTCPLVFKNLTYWIFRYGFLHDIRWINKWIEIELDLRLKKNVPAHYLARYTPAQARLALWQVDKIDLDSQKRNKKAELYRQGLADLGAIALPPEDKNSANVYLSFPVQYQEREKMLKWLMLKKRDIAAQHLKNCADLPVFSDFYRDCPVARKTAGEVMLLPLYTRYPDSEIQKNIKAIRSYFYENSSDQSAQTQ